jgi:transposase
MARKKAPPKAELRERVARLVRAGNFIETAAAACGVSLEDHEAWMETPAYRKAIEDALAEAESIAVVALAKGVREDWRAAAWYLERAHPDRWGSKSARGGGVLPRVSGE